MDRGWNGLDRRNLNNTLDTTSTTLASKLTPREREILECISRGELSKTIAHNLQIGHETLRSHRKNILKKLACRNMIQAIASLQASASKNDTNICDLESPFSNFPTTPGQP